MCKARRVNDQYHCHVCGFQWDVDDEDRPMCKPGNRVGLGIALMLVASVASATDCDATRAAVYTSTTLQYAEVCLSTMNRYGKNVALQSAECLNAVLEHTKLVEVIDGLQAQGCTTYTNLPDVADSTRLRDIGRAFAAGR